MLSSEEFSLAWYPVFQYLCSDINVFQFPGFENKFPLLQTCTALVRPVDCTEGSCSSNKVIFVKVLIFNFPFFQFRTIISFLDKYSSISGVVTHRSCV